MQIFNILCLLIASASLGWAVKRSEGAQMYLCLGVFAVIFYFLIAALIAFRP